MAVADGCPDDPKVTNEEDLTTTTWSGCADATAIRFVVIAGSPHAWPGSESTPLSGATAGMPYANYDASYEVWAFLASHPR